MMKITKEQPGQPSTLSLRQKLEDGAELLLGSHVTISFDIKASSGSTITTSLQGLTASDVATGSWQRMSHTFDTTGMPSDPNSDGSLIFALLDNVASGDEILVAAVQIDVGSSIHPYRSKPVHDDLNACRRRLQVIGQNVWEVV